MECIDVQLGMATLDTLPKKHTLPDLHVTWIWDFMYLQLSPYEFVWRWGTKIVRWNERMIIFRQPQIRLLNHIYIIYIYNIPSYPHSWMIFPLYPQDSDIGVVSHWQRTTFQQALVTITAAPAKMEKSLFAISHVSTVYHITGMTMNDYESPVGYIIHIHSHSSYSIYHHITIE